ncbi:hypothetical protein ACO2RV_14600 [Ancylobacter sp. VNQ12]|uniref:hypothetical protein n=1 Tax=Ancylobacter sp. VNQ12 TaxID=3400920 RepID=UPI003C0C4825
MSPEERAEYDRWQRSHKPGAPAKRAAARAEREANARFRESAQRSDARPPTAEGQAIAARIAELEDERTRLVRTTPDDEGVFG